MSNESFPYDQWVNEALHLVLKKALKKLSESGPVDNHHFYINFRTTCKGVKIPDSLLAQYPENITIVLQHQFDGLTVTEKNFEVFLVFNGKRNKLEVPFNAVTSFADPSVDFGLQMSSEIENDVTLEKGILSGDHEKNEANEHSLKDKVDSNFISPKKLEQKKDGSKKENNRADLNKRGKIKKHGNSASAEVIALDKFRKK